ncbi:glycine dehydrogenase subunit 1 [Halogeometricum borinquense DSM 11551]|uniref:Glycine dehydrogenase (Decarboxylating) alpha subunit n=1 Tax=Halogeometricum borinquense (strain ATCC 700274 / DSM 11551 / JCM 10706 / KCTC 4070 / PR3) TaxID=469382 RepID=E4NP01_HALBP|nr:aminomethyl-transferring glycine dehydrogenase subunit GcvPA [Halogeometricum borinquense]ADQ66432.1 glycine dehydrogenase (decarboxylating) alpha subunit [Halogeometricum borinquense DSM 11551]ELY31152.1 glycine dehydrogenase subunit 1 [Halogeometricum borinquense DSM 11551]
MTRGSPYAPHTDEETAAMLDAVGVEDEESLFDIPEDVRFDGEFGIEARSERDIRSELATTFKKNQDLTEFLGRGHHSHYIPSLVDDITRRSEFLTSYTQYQPEITQGFLQALFEYQSILVELTGLPVANCSMYDAATALAEAARLAGRVRRVSGTQILVPEILHEGKRSVLDNYVAGTDLTVETYPMDDGNVDLDAVAELADEDTAMVYAENPTVRGTIEEHLSDIGDVADDAGALFCLGTDTVALALLEEPASVGADIVVGEADALGMPTAYGMGLGLFATRESFLRQVPGRLVGASEDAGGKRAYTLTLQTREQHIRKERATSNICTNQAWVALRAAMHAAYLGPDGLTDLAKQCVTDAASLASDLTELRGIKAPVHDRHHFREFVAHTDQPAQAIASDLEAEGFAVHVVGEHELQVCITDLNAPKADELVAAFEEVL